DGTVVRDGKGTTDSGVGAGSQMFDDSLQRALSRIEADLRITLVVIAEINTAVIGRPLGLADVAVEFFGKRVRAGAVAVHKVELRSLMALEAIVVPGVGDPFAVGRNHRIVIGPLSVRQSPQGAISDAEFINFRIEESVIGFGMAICGNDQ